ncbi:hypothetical protein BDV96DRAFT_574601 [Lophiotrema nucula]|uniref:VPS9 domain-containing protein n=1 Tax=Lophiotrema nucula TaxID=690887 RepID=A0A6A5ZBL2_9PLEO|nr:hypothetical protein BDV96DRAFT_574601 [Lophiotrema nucula]
MAERPNNSLQTSTSFTRLEAKQRNPQSRSRASTLSGPVPDILDPLNQKIAPDVDGVREDGDIFATQEEEEEANNHDERTAPDSFEELPIEIRSLTERFLESLNAKVHPSPLSADALSDLFQDFYTRASSHINTHIATLSSRLGRENVASQGKKGSSPAGSTKAGSVGSRKASDSVGEQQMLTASELVDRKKARRLLEIKRINLEEAVERAVCEKVYDRVWRHRSTDDEERDHKLRSRTAALSLVGIGLKELLMTAEELTEEERQKTKEKEPEIRGWLSSARDDIRKMDDDKYPLGKLHHLTAAHKSIVEALSKIFPASSSADEILPTLIYALITSPPETINVISNLNFIQRFRGSSRMDGETAYCLVNLEAAVSFLETVDLSSLRAEEASRPERSNSRPSTPKGEITPMPLGLAQAPDLTQTPATPIKDAAAKAPPSPGTKAQRRLSNLIQTHTNRIEAASDAVRDSILDSADQALDTINNTLENSFKFLFGRMKERDPNSPVQEEPQLPKTLGDARKLVNEPKHLEVMEDDTGSISAASSVIGEEHPEDSKPKDAASKMTDLFGGRRQMRDRSVDSTQSGGSGKRVAFSASSNDGKVGGLLSVKTEPVPTTGNSSAIDSLRNMGSSLNPLNRFAGVNLPRFGRAVGSNASTPGLTSPTTEQSKAFPPPLPPKSSSGDVPLVDDKGQRAIAALESMKKTTPPVKKFLEAKDAQDLKVKEVEELLQEYQRLASAMRQAINY